MGADNEEILEELSEEDIHMMDEYTISDCPDNPYVLGVIEGPFMGPFNEDNGNGRWYLEDTIDEGIINNPYTKRMIENKSLLGEAHHPLERSSIWMDESAISTRKLWRQQYKGKPYLFGRADILDTPKGRIVNTLARYGTNIGVSARANGKGVKKNGHLEIRKENYKFKTFDAVLNPGFVDSRPSKYESDGNPMKCYEENTDNMKDSLYEEIENQVKQKICDSKMLQYYIDFCEDDRLKDLIPLTEDNSQEEDSMNQKAVINEELENKINSLEEENRNLLAKYNNLEKDYSLLEERASEDIKVRDERISYLTNQLNKMNEESDSQVDSLLDELSELKNRIVGLNEEKYDLQMKVSELNSRLLSTEDYKQDADNKNTLLEEQVEELVNEATALKEQAKELIQQNESLQEEFMSTEVTTPEQEVYEESEVELTKEEIHMKNLSKVVEKFRNPVSAINEEQKIETRSKLEDKARVTSLVKLVGGK